MCAYTVLVLFCIVNVGNKWTRSLETQPNSGSQIEETALPNTERRVREVDEDSSEFGVVDGRKKTTCPCGMANKDAGRIINGTETQESEYPFMVSIRKPNGRHNCGGSILTPYHILTAAHCVSDEWKKTTPIPQNEIPVVGVHETNKNGTYGQTQFMKVVQIFVPKEWYSRPTRHTHLAGDIAILLLDRQIRFSKWVSPICLTPDFPSITNGFIKAMGWGQTEQTTSSHGLREALVQVLDQSSCNNDPKEVCFKNGPTGTCFGDSGGPYVYVDPETNRYTQVSIVSYVYDKCKGKHFVGTNLTYWYDWVQNVVQSTSKGFQICRKAD
ncbi:protease [Nesidiocoris tenuis]|uniref:Protease n=1 Tax=Nesidiocoris tenuis TaxID=355587 RepID=A0ABN7AIP7_9HEMI|nr:protease [Nesidiocoris tenuis]